MQPKRYVQEPAREFKGAFLPDDVYSQVLDSFVIVCTDFVAINRARRTFYLPKREIQASKGIWRFGGRQKAGETKQGSCARLAKRELKLDIEPNRFEYVTTTEDLWSYRHQEPKNAGVHDDIHVFVIELTTAELKQAADSLDPGEYDLSFKIQEFDRERLIREQVYPQVIDLYDIVFPSR